MSQHTDFNEDMTNESTSVACSKVRLWKMDTQKNEEIRTAWMDNINTWTGLPMEESIRMTEDRDKWRKYVHGVVNLRIKDGQRREHFVS